MDPISAAQIAAATGGRVVSGDPQTLVTCVCTDTRAMKPNSLFIAIKGDTFDGHDHVDKALASGATVALVHVPRAACRVGEDASHAARSTQHAAVLVDDTRLAMGRLANYVRRQFSKAKVIAVAGSNGKTGTKHLIHSVLATTLKGSMSPKSFNNDIGVPITLFSVEPEDDFVVVEVGTNHPGEVRHLSLMCEPDVAVITSIGEEHMEFFKTLDGVRRENADIVAGLRGDRFVLINGDDAGLRTLLPDATTVGLGDCDLIARDIHTTLDGTRFNSLSPRERAGERARDDSECFELGDPPLPNPLPAGEGTGFSLPNIGRHNASNALVAIAIGRHFGLTDDDIRKGLSSATSPEMRMQKRAIGPITILNDAYNANPTSVRAALNTLSEIEWTGRKIVVLGEMRELGDTAPDAHRAVKDMISSLAFSQAFIVGKQFQPTCENASDHWFPDSTSASEPIASQLLENDLVLIKGSRSMKMETIERAIEKRFGQ